MHAPSPPLLVTNVIRLSLRLEGEVNKKERDPGQEFIVDLVHNKRFVS